MSDALGAVYLEPARPGDLVHYLSFFRADADRSTRLAAAPACLWQPGLDRGAPDRAGGRAGSGQRPLLATGTGLRTYRLAVAATAEYTANRGGTVASAQAAILTTVNRVTGVYERELAVRLQLVRNDGSLIYTNASTDPYTNNDPNSLVGQSQANLTSVLGTAGFDVGHVFSTAGGGLAYVGVVCNATYKAAGETGIANPVGDAFDIDYVAHELGHQFGGNHTFNGSLGSCGGNANPGTAYEPGSGSTIMAYAGICSANNLQARSDPYFHVVSYEEIEAYLTSAACGTVSSTGNSVPGVGLPAGGKTLPIGTPFRLTASGTDADGDPLTFCWEEWDLAQNGAPPLFRSFLPTPSPTRYFPRLSDLLAGATNIGETLPTTTRPLNFRVTVRDAHNGLQGVVGGINSSPVLALGASSAAGPFVVTAPNTALTWAAGATQTVTWDVANTTAAPVSAASVNIRLSTDGGLTYPTVLVANTPNDGAEAVTVPSLATTQARIMVEAADNYFFDISNANFTISGSVAGPALGSLSPASGPVGTSVVITGTNLTGATAVSFNGTGAPFTVNSATQITALVPTGATSGPVTVTTPGGPSNAVAFAVAVPTSTLATLSPSSGTIGTTVVITGTNFTGAGTVSFNGVSAPFTFNSPTQLTTVVPFGATFGPVTVTVSGSSNGLVFTVIPPLPLVVSFSPMGGPVGTVVAITGTNFGGATAVAFNGVAAPFTFGSGTALTATVPAGATTGPITVTTAGGTGSSSSSFTVLTATLPSLTVSSPQTIPSGAYFNIDITGTGEGTLGGAVLVAGAFTVQAGGLFDDGCQLLTGPGSFALAADATLRICSPGGISASGATGSVQVTGPRSFSPAGSYVYNGTVAQLTGSGLPAAVRNLAVSNAAGVGLTQDVAITRVLTLQAGNLSLGASNLLLLSNAAGTALVVNRGSGRVLPTGAGRATMQRFITVDPAQPYAGPGYRHYSPPVANTTVADLAVPGLFAPLLNSAYNALPPPALPPAQFPNVFDYQESRVTPAFPAFVTGFRSPAGPADALVPTAGYTVNLAPAATVDLSGLLNTGALNTGPLTRGATANSGWQFLGNPYPAPLDWAVVEATPGALPAGLGAAIYVFEPTSQYGGFYRSYVAGVGTGGFAGVLPAMQGFFVRAAQAVPGGFTFQDLFRVTTYQDPPFRRQTAGPDLRPRLRLTLGPAAGPAGPPDETLVYFDPGATATGTDAAFDAPKLPNSSQLGLASRVPGPPASEPLAISGLPPALLAAGTRILLELELPAAGPYQLNAAEVANFAPTLPLALLDRATGIRTDLRLAPSYAFTAAQAGALAGRFELLLGRTATATTSPVPASAFSVWPNPVSGSGGRLRIALATAAPAATAVLRTILGQPVRTQALRNGTAEMPTNGLATGTYLLTVQVPGEPGVTQRVLVE